MCGKLLGILSVAFEISSMGRVDNNSVFPFKIYLKLDFVFQQCCPACPIRHFSQCQTSEGPRRHSKEKSYVDAFNNRAQHSTEEEEEDGMGTKNLTKQGMKTSSRILSPTMISLDT